MLKSSATGGTYTASTPDRAAFPLRWLIIIVVVSLALRCVLLASTMSNPGFEWVDADRYMRQGHEMAIKAGPWHERMLGAVSYRYLGWTFFLPPLYPLALSLFATLPGYPLTAAIAHAVVGALSVLFVFVIGRRLYSTRAGLIAAALYSLWPSALTSTHVFVQEQLYIPLELAAIALLVSGLDEEKRWTPLATGVLFGLAALTRSMILYYIVLLPLLLFLTSRNRLVVRRQVLLLLAGAALVVVPYSALISWKSGQVMIIENHGGFDMMKYSDRPIAGRPTLGVGLQVLAEQIVTRPFVFLGRWLDYVRLLFKPNGVRLLDGFGVFGTRSLALLGVAVRIVCDFWYLAILGLTPLGIAVARRFSHVATVGTWVLVVVAFTALSGAAGARYRAPTEPILIVFACGALVLGWRRPRSLVLLTGAAGALVAVLLAAQMQPLGKMPAYGLAKWSPQQGIGESTADGDAGFDLPLDASGVTIASLANTAEPLRVRLAVDGHVLFDSDIPSDGRPIRFFWTKERTGYVRIQTMRSGTGAAFPFRVTVLRRAATAP